MSERWALQQIAVAEHPLLDARGFYVDLPCPIDELVVNVRIATQFSAAAEAALQDGDLVQKAARDLLRWAGYKPTGRGKPASEFLKNMAETGAMPAINPAIDTCNAVSMHSGWPISAVDADKLTSPLEIRLGRAGERYAFNATGQEIDLENLLSLCDAAGPCANGVKDAQRTKTDASTRRMLVIIWGSRTCPGLAEATALWLAEQLAGLGTEVTAA